MKPTRQQRMARAKFALPSFVTLLSIACGFGSIVISVDNAPIGDPHAYRMSAILLVLAGVFDALDGFVPPTPPPNSACSSIRSPT